MTATRCDVYSQSPSGCADRFWGLSCIEGYRAMINKKSTDNTKVIDMTDNIDRAIDKMIQRSQREWHDGRESLLFAQAAMNLAKTKMLLSPGEGKSRLIFVEEDASHDS